VPKEELFRQPIIYVITSLGAVFGFLLTYMYEPLMDRISDLEQGQQKATIERTETKERLRYLERKRD